MLPLQLPTMDRPLRLLCLGAHPDDLEIGCGGTVMALVAARPVECTWVVWSADAERRREAEGAAARVLAGAAGAEVIVESFPDARFPAVWSDLKDRFEALKRVGPDLILTHRRHDRHQDHRTVAELTWNTWRHHLVLEYEIPKYEGDLGRPNLYVPLDASLVEHKVEILLESFRSQRPRAWFDAETFRGLMRLRGVECGASSGYAEAFDAAKVACSFFR